MTEPKYGSFNQLMENVDWHLLAEQKETLLAATLQKEPLTKEQIDHFDGLLHLIDGLQDHAEFEGLWHFPKSKEEE